MIVLFLAFRVRCRVAPGNRTPGLPQIPLCEDQHNGMYVESLVMLRTLPAGRNSPYVTRFLL